jgi:hypothetical protein
MRHRLRETVASVDQVEAAIDELVVQVGFQVSRLVADDHGEHVVAERGGCVAMLTDSGLAALPEARS